MRNIVLLPHQDESFVRDLQMTADLLLYLNVKSSPIYWCTSPLKMFEYMAAGIPVIASNFKLWKSIVEENNCGICVDPQNHKEITSAVEKLLKNPEIANEMGKNGQKIVKEFYNWKNEEKKLITFYKSLIE